MNTFRLWSPPVTISLLLHATVIALVTYRLNTSSAEIKSVQTITVEMLGITPAAVSKPHIQKPAPVITAKPDQEPAKIEQPTASNEPTPAPVTTEQNSTPTPESTQLNLEIPPESSITSKARISHFVKAIYPLSEQRDGKKASVLLEVTLDKNGKVLDINILKSAGNAFDSAIKESIMKSTFSPSFIGKEAVPSRVLIPYTLKLE